MNRSAQAPHARRLRFPFQIPSWLLVQPTRCGRLLRRRLSGLAALPCDVILAHLPSNCGRPGQHNILRYAAHVLNYKDMKANRPRNSIKGKSYVFTVVVEPDDDRW